ncbi:MAG: nucleoside deaminase [Clostridia bacterium]|nr:nucleoside deaminase [Clostridia bacterium]
MNYVMKLAIDRARETMNQNFGGPFGAAIVDKNGEVIAVNSNSVLKENDPTAHAEINTIREACKKVGTYDLKEYVLYTTAYPCPMCLSAIIWANISKVYYGCTPKDAEEIGFRDDFIYRFIANNCSDQNILEINSLDREECITLFDEYAKKNKTIY